MAQFVPVKLDVESDEYRQWRMDHPSEGSTIPKLFVVRADGATLYGKSGSLPGDQLPLMLQQALQHSGKILKVRDSSTLATAADEFERLKADGQITAAIKALGRGRKIGEPGNIASFAHPASRVNELANETALAVKSELESLVGKMDGDAGEKLAAVLEFLRIKREYGGLSLLKPEWAAFQKSHLTQGNSTLAREAKVIDGAKSADSKSKKTRAIVRLQDLIAKTENEEVKLIAEEILAELETESVSKD